MLVPAGFTSTIRRPALSALPARMIANCAQPASRIDRLSPDLAAAPQVRYHLRRCGEEVRVADDLAVRSRQEPGHAHVHADFAPGGRQRYGLGLGGCDDVPPAPLALELEGLDRAGDRPVLADLDRADRLERCLRPPAISGRLPLGAITGDEHRLAETAVRLEARISSAALSRAVVERVEYGVEPAQGLLLGGERVAPLPVRVRLPDFLELPGLHAVGDADVTHLPRLAALFQRGVVQVAVVGQQPCRAVLLGSRRVGAELVGSSHLHRVRVVGVGHCLGGCRLAGSFASPLYGSALTFPSGHAERKKCGFTSGLKGRSARRADLMANAIRPRTLT